MLHKTSPRKDFTLKRTLANAVIICLLVSVASPALAQDSANGSGADTYKAKCAKCHGADGLSHTFAGKMTKAASLKSPMVTSATDADLIAAVTNGKKKMPAFKKKLTDDQIKSVVAYIRTLPDPAPGNMSGM
jgi:cytochrome c6